MTLGRAALLAIGAAFIAAEIARPTILHHKKIASRALLIASQHSEASHTGTLDPELLADLPRIWPNAPSSVHESGTSPVRLSGQIDDPYTRSPGAAVFPIVDGTRIAIFWASYVGDRYTLVFPQLPPSSTRHEVAIGMVSADQRGYFHSTSTIELRMPPAKRR